MSEKLYQIKNALLNQIISSQYNDKKLTKASILHFHFVTIFKEIEKEKDIPLKIKAKILLGIVKIYIRKLKYLLDDCNDSFRTFKAIKRARKVDKKNILKVNYLKENILESQAIDFDVSTFEDLSQETEQFLPSVGDFNFDEVEVQRNDADFSNDFIMDNEISFHEKKRRRIIDSVTEFTERTFKNKLKNISNHFNQTQKEKEDKEESVSLPAEIFDFIKENLRIENIETARNEVEVDFYEPSFNDTTINQNNFSMVDNYEEISKSEQSEINTDFDIEDEETKFSDLVKEKSRKEKAKMFLDLLKMCSRGKIIAKQNDDFSEIFCVKNQEYIETY